MIKMQRNYIIIMFFLLVLISSSCSVEKLRLKSQADLDLSEMISVNIGDNVYRALKGYSEIYPYLIVEKIRLSLTEGDESVLVRKWHLEEMEGGQLFQHFDEEDNFQNLKWRGNNLEFIFVSTKGRQKCIISEIIEDKPSISCKSFKK